jgi:4-carboxymuconolactone decarboxylase
MAESEAYRKGAEIRRRMLGAEYVQESLSDPVTRAFAETMTETVWGVIWQRPGLDLKTKTLICVVSDATAGRTEELALHLRMALREGWTEQELTDAIIHLAGYIGAPLTRGAILTARKVFEQVRAGK